MRLSPDLAQQSVLDLLPGHVPHMEDATLRVSALAAKIQFAMARDITFIELQPKFHQLSNSIRSPPDNCANRRRLATSRPRRQSVARVPLGGTTGARRSR